VCKRARPGACSKGVHGGTGSVGGARGERGGEAIVTAVGGCVRRAGVGAGMAWVRVSTVVEAFTGGELTHAPTHPFTGAERVDGTGWL